LREKRNKREEERKKKPFFFPSHSLFRSSLPESGLIEELAHEKPKIVCVCVLTSWSC